MNIESTLKQYHELPYLEKRVLQLRALSRVGLAKTDFLRVLNDSDLKNFLGKQFNNNILTSIFQNLSNKNLLQLNNQVTTNVLHQITLDAVTGEYSATNAYSLLKTAHNNSSFVDKLRLAIYLNEPILLHEAISDMRGDIFVYNIIKKLAQDFNSTIFTDEMLRGLVPEIRYWLIIARIYCILQANRSVKINEITIIKEWIDNEFIHYPITSNVVLDLLLDFFFLQGNLDKIGYLVANTRHNLMKNQSILGVIAFVQDNQSQALIHFDTALKAMKELSKRRNVCLPGIYGICHILSLLKENQSNNHSKVQDLLKHYMSLSSLCAKELEKSRYRGDTPEILEYFTQHHYSSYGLLMLLVDFLLSGIDAKKVDERILFITGNAHKVLNNVLDGLLLFLVLYWTKSKAIDLQKYASELREMYNEAFPALIWAIRQQLGTSITENDKLDVSTEQSYRIDFTEIIKSKDEWERVLDNLKNYFNKNDTTKSYDKRLVWMLYPNKHREMIVPVEQKRINANDSWNKGRTASLKRLYETQHNLDYLTEYDKAVLSCAKSDYSYYGNFYIDSDKALLALINNPLVFDGDTGAHIELTKTTPELIFKEVKGNFIVKLSESVNMHQPTVRLKKESDNKYQVVEISQSTLDIVKILGNDGIKVPKVARNKILSLLQQAATNISIRTEFDSTEGLESEPADASIVVQLTFIDEILKARLFVRPFGGKGSYYKPNKGTSSIVAQIDNNYKSVSRDLRLERDNVNHLLQACPILQEHDCIDYEWQVAELETALEILQQFNNYKNNNSLTIEWPKGQSLFVDKEISFTDLKLNITGNNQWFNFDGDVTIDDTQVIEIRSFLQNLERAKGRFIELSDKRFIALTASFAKRIQELKKAARIDEKGQAIHKLGAPLLQEFVDNSKNTKTDNHWQTHINKINLTNSYDPKIPHNLQAELRPYQIEGFKWLARLSNLGFGACLADDMGLGKTVQTIALLLEQAVQGACLVVAPASVCYVWQEECQKFAPSLNCIILGSNNREEQMAALTKMDVLICSYGLLYQVAELLTNKQFQVVVLDEAQAIKNNTKRFKIITELQAVNRIALSGTPIENRTEELWNLFEFLNPGFLGSRQLFQEKYTKPIERGTDVVARNTLKRLIQPFILRRMKSKVLDELPSKTEQTIFVEPSDEEKNFYEALRRESLARISSISDADSAKKRFSILAEITKLRRACCDCSLIKNNIEIPNSKLEAFDEIVQDLKENNHRALVFSQYVDYLTIVRKRLEQQQISYQYLDGSTPQKQRKASVEAFQGGEGDLFLLSLKAGGVGLNLTAADYVIHLDPWWNPAVEDQASDRAHRLGQTRPVTVYRLVMKHSIEEKILKMHRDKRDLAIGLLDDSEKSASLTEVDLLELISQASICSNIYNYQ